MGYDGRAGKVAGWHPMLVNLAMQVGPDEVERACQERLGFSPFLVTNTPEVVEILGVFR